MKFGMGDLEMSCKWIEIKKEEWIEIKKEDLLSDTMTYINGINKVRINLDLCLSMRAAGQENKISFESRDEVWIFTFASSELFNMHWDMIEEILIRP